MLMNYNRRDIISKVITQYFLNSSLIVLLLPDSFPSKTDISGN